jgi:hypothetical protein
MTIINYDFIFFIKNRYNLNIFIIFSVKIFVFQQINSFSNFSLNNKKYKRKGRKKKNCFQLLNKLFHLIQTHFFSFKKLFFFKKEKTRTKALLHIKNINSSYLNLHEKYVALRLNYNFFMN